MTNKPILSIRVDERNAVHARVTVFNRGAHCGVLTVLAEDVPEIERLLEGGEWRRGGQRVEYEVEGDPAAS